MPKLAVSSSRTAESGTIGARLRGLRASRGLSQRKFAAALGVPERSYIRYETGQATVPLEVLESAATFGGIGVAELIEKQDNEKSDGLGDDVKVPRLSIEASAGTGAVQEIEYVFEYFSLPEKYLRRTLGIDPNQARVITVIGDSMEPTLRSGDPILVDTSATQYAGDGLYVVVFKDVLLVKRLQRKLDDTLIVKSDNPSYEAYDLTTKEERELKVAGRVVAALRRY